MRWEKVAVLAVAACMCSSCAIVDATFEPTYVPRLPACAAQGRTVVLTQPVDQRPEKELIGIKKNGYGNESASIYIEAGPADVPGWVNDALAKELETSGVTVVRSPEPAPLGAPTITVVVRQFFVEPKLGALGGDIYGQVAIILEVLTPQGIQYERLFVGDGRCQWFWGTESEYREALDDAASDAIARAAGGLCELLATPEANR